MSKTLSYFIRAALVSSVFTLTSACTKTSQSSTSSVSLERFELENRDIVFSKSKETMSVMINLFPHKKVITELPETKRDKVVEKTILYYCKNGFEQARFKDTVNATVQLVYVSGYDEYGSPDYSTLKNVGSAIVSKNEKALTIGKSNYTF
jgi:hypothetical protein